MTEVPTFSTAEQAVTGYLDAVGNFVQFGAGGGGATSNVNLNQVAGTSTSVGTGVQDAGSQRVVVAQDTATIAGSPTSTVLLVQSVTSAAGSGGASSYSATTGASATQVKNAAGQIYAISIGNSNVTNVYVQFFDVANGSITVGTTAPTFSLFIPAGGGSNLPLPVPIQFSTAINYACTTTRSGNTAPANTVDVNFFYK